MQWPCHISMTPLSWRWWVETGWDSFVRKKCYIESWLVNSSCHQSLTPTLEVVILLQFLPSSVLTGCDTLYVVVYWCCTCVIVRLRLSHVATKRDTCCTSDTWAWHQQWLWSVTVSQDTRTEQDRVTSENQSSGLGLVNTFTVVRSLLHNFQSVSPNHRNLIM